MLCEFCKVDIDKQGVLIDTKEFKKRWVCSECFVKNYIAGGVTLIHHWGYFEEKAEEEPKPEEG